MRQVSPKLQTWLDNFNVQVAAIVAGGFKQPLLMRVKGWPI